MKSIKVFTVVRLRRIVLFVLLIQAKHQRLLIILSEETGNLSPNSGETFSADYKQTTETEK